jgi:hypothetical protein
MSEFYVGYQPTAPPGIARFVLRITVVTLMAVATIAVVLVALQAPFAPATFEYGVERDFSGVLRASPVPHLVAGQSRYLLSGDGKHGFTAPADWWDRQVSLRGSLIHRGPMRMIQPVGTSIGAGDDAGPDAVIAQREQRTLTGEIVDSKCYLGVMNPGAGKVHRECAVRCLSGGIPAAFAVRGGETYVLAGPVKRYLQRVAEPLTLTGSVYRLGDLTVFELAE